MEHESRLPQPGTNALALASRYALVEALPTMISLAGPAASFAWDEFFAGQIGNPHTRSAYLHAARQFLSWCQSQAVDLAHITPSIVGRYFSQHPGSIPTQKLHMAAIRGLFDVLVQRHVVVLNPALSVKTKRYSVVEGKTPAIFSVEQARRLLAAIEFRTPVDYRDRAVIATLIYTAVRAGAVARLLCATSWTKARSSRCDSRKRVAR